MSPRQSSRRLECVELMDLAGEKPEGKGCVCEPTEKIAITTDKPKRHTIPDRQPDRQKEAM